MGLAERFWAKVSPEPNTGCWLWSGAVTPAGYGKIAINRRLKAAHRLSYEMNVGPIPEGLEIDHLCKVKCCVNPAHLEPVTHSENCRRGPQGEHTARIMRAKTHCPRGHPYSGKNLKIGAKGERRCRTCENASVSRWRKRRQEVCYRTL